MESCINFAVYAKDLDFSVYSNVTSISDESDVVITLKVKAAERIKNVSTFKFTLNFDHDAFQYKGLSASDCFSDDEFKTHLNNDELIVVYLTSGNGSEISVGKDMDVFDVHLRAIKTTCKEKLNVRCAIDGVGDYDANRLQCDLLEELHFDVLRNPTCDCRLKALKPDVDANLEPNFSKDVYEYILHVGSEVKSVKFLAEPIDPNVIVRQKKKKLNKAGEKTEILIEVHSKDKKNEKVYKVEVVRDVGEKSTKVPKKTKTKNEKENDVSNRKDENNEEIADLKVKNKNASSDDFSNQKLIVKENGFNVITFIAIMIVCISLWLIITKSVHKGKNKHSDLKN